MHREDIYAPDFAPVLPAYPHSFRAFSNESLRRGHIGRTGWHEYGRLLKMAFREARKNGLIATPQPPIIIDARKRQRRTPKRPRFALLDLPDDIGASCFEFLHIQEQCSLKRTSKYMHKFAVNSLKRERKKAVLRLYFTVGYKRAVTAKAVNIEIGRLLKKVSKVCPRIRSLWYQENFRTRSGLVHKEAARISFKPEFANPDIRGAPMRDIAMFLPCARYIDSFHMTGYGTAGDKLKLRKFESLREVRVNLGTFRTLKNLDAGSLHAKEFWAGAPSVRINLSFCTESYKFEPAPQVYVCRHLLGWQQLSSISIDHAAYLPLAQEPRFIARMLLSIPATLRSFELKVFVYLDVEHSESERAKFVRIVEHIIKLRFPKSLVCSRSDACEITFQASASTDSHQN